ncbi:MAG: glycine cleavage system protein GcvH [Chloroflexota bacterium]|nr:glycine cleavage system protein GcvH [Chloroflexota bacterium]
MDPADRRYTKEHEWVRLDGDTAVVGITDFAQDQLGDVVYVDLPKVGDRVELMKPFGVIESVKTASDLFAPVTGTVIEVNEALTNSPQSVNDAPYDTGWLIKVHPDDPSEIDTLMTADQYAEHVGGS